MYIHIMFATSPALRRGRPCAAPGGLQGDCLKGTVTICMYMCIYIYIYTCLHMYIYIYIYTHIHTYANIHVLISSIGLHIS